MAIAEIDHVSVLVLNAGDDVGDCSGKVIGEIERGVSADVNPDPKKCGGCKLSEYCTQSVAE